MNKLLGVLSLSIVLSLIASTADARPAKGFLKGPYLTVELGTLQMDNDTDQVSGEKIGRDFEPTFGFIFGWNLSDNFSPELQGRYATNLKSGRRLHVAQANISGKYTFIIDELVDFPSLRILPFLKAGMALRISVLPGNRNSTKDTVYQTAWGPSPGGGLAFLWKKYFMFGIDLQGDMLIFDDIRQTVNGTGNTLVYKGGFHPSFSAMAIIGVHY